MCTCLNSWEGGFSFKKEILVCSVFVFVEGLRWMLKFPLVTHRLCLQGCSGGGDHDDFS